MQCKECGATFIQNREWQRFCCTQHRNAYNQRNFYQREQKQKSDYLIASNDINILKQENERLTAQLKSKDAEIKQLEQLSDKLNGDLEQSSLRPNPNITIHHHSAPTAAQARSARAEAQLVRGWRSALAELLPPQQVPARIRVVPAIPLLPSLKPDLAALRALPLEDAPGMLSRLGAWLFGAVR